MKKVLTSAVVAGILGGAAYFATQTDVANAGDEKEKCYGVVKAGHNGCGNLSGTHSCAGQSTVDGDAGEWIKLPKGVCSKLVGGLSAAEAAEATTAAPAATEAQ